MSPVTFVGEGCCSRTVFFCSSYKGTLLQIFFKNYKNAVLLYSVGYYEKAKERSLEVAMGLVSLYGDTSSFIIRY